MDNTICYEQPLNERIRTLLRLEFLFKQVSNALQNTHHWGTRAALQAFFDVLDLTSRNELRAELLKELDRHSASLNRLRQTSRVDENALDQVLSQIGQAMQDLHRMDGLALEAIRQNTFLNAVRQRSSIPGGTCRFDLPGFHHWLQRPSEERNQQLEEWIEPFRPMQAALRLVLQLIRTSSIPTSELALRGFFQKSLNSSTPSPLVRVILPAGSTVFPEISGGRHRFTIRFMEQHDPNQRPSPTADDIPFHLVCCLI